MIIFRTSLVVYLLALMGYTTVTIYNHGWNLFPHFFGDMLAMSWAGQFNFDFMGFLFLSASWTMWRNRFSGVGVVLGILAFFGGMMFLAIYLLYLSFHPDADINRVLIGDRVQTGSST
ncbi:MAG: hypothetical protein HUJ31_16185 [Pseudomonadales bacterium]|nr:hypothetical protein [Pseudomonadales bacterium]